MTHVIAEPCVEEYPADCVCEGQRAQASAPIAEPVCPVEAIYYEDDLRTAGGYTLAGLIPALRAGVDSGWVLRRTR